MVKFRQMVLRNKFSLTFCLLLATILLKGLVLGSAFNTNLTRLSLYKSGGFTAEVDYESGGRRAIFVNFERCKEYFYQGYYAEAFEECRIGDIPARYWYVFAALVRESHPDQVPEEALQAYKLALQLDPKAADARLQLAVLYEQIGQFREMILVLEPMVEEADSQSPEWYRLLGAAYAGNGMYEDAEKTFKTGLERFPDDGLLILSLGNLYFEQGNEEASVWYDVYLTGNENPPFYVLDRRSRIAEIRMEWTKLVTVCQQIVLLDPENIWCLENLAESYLQLDEPGDAARILRKLLVLDPDNQWAEDTLRRIESP